jgi:signal transduction histidine kinase
LTLFYILVIGFLLVVFSILLFFSYRYNLKNGFEGDFVSERAQAIAIEKATARLRNLIIVLDGGVIVLVGALGYWLAGKTLEPIEKNLEAQKRFAADASHELRTPLAIMKTDLDVALMGTSKNNDLATVLESNVEEVDRMTRIVEDLLILSIMDSEHDKLVLMKTDLPEMLSQTVQRMMVYAKEKNIHIVLSMDRTVSVLSDSSKLQWALLNVLKNAIDYSNNDKEIKVNLQRTGDLAEITVADEGVGIGPEQLPHVFDRFYRADKSRHRGSRGGAGLGLAIVKSIIHGHHGSIHIQSTLGKGTFVTISLPLFPAS